MIIENPLPTNTAMTKEEFCMAFNDSYAPDDLNACELMFVDDPDQPDFEPYWKIEDVQNGSGLDWILDDDLDFDASVIAYNRGARGWSMLVRRGESPKTVEFYATLAAKYAAYCACQKAAYEDHKAAYEAEMASTDPGVIAKRAAREEAAAAAYAAAGECLRQMRSEAGMETL
jgi:hypothetical protein